MAKAKMCRLSESQLKTKLDFIDSYIGASNAATGSTFDANSNVSNKNVATMLAELNKDINIQIKNCMEMKSLKHTLSSLKTTLFMLMTKLVRFFPIV